MDTAAATEQAEEVVEMLLAVFRRLLRHPGFTLATVVCAAFGVASVSAMWAVLYGVLLAPLPYPQPDRLVTVWEVPTQAGTAGRVARLSADTVLDLSNEVDGLEAVAALTATPVTVTGADAPHRVLAGRAMPELFSDVLRVPVAHGRPVSRDDIGGEPVALLSHAFWLRNFAADPTVVGRTLYLDGEATRIIGVLPPRLDFENPDPEDLHRIDLWRALDVERYRRLGRGLRFLTVVGRLRPEVSRGAATAELAALAATLAKRHPETQAGWSFHLVPLDERLTAHVRGELSLLFAGVGLVFLIACANVSNLLAVRALQRRNEMAVRCALGASRRNLLAQLIGESTALSLLGGALGFPLALWLGSALVGLSPVELPRLGASNLSASILAATAVTTVAILSLATLPALFLLLRDGTLRPALPVAGASAPRRATRLHHGLVVLELTLAMALATCGGLLLRSLWSLQRVDLGFEPQGVLTAQIDLPASRYDSPAAIADFQRRLTARVAGLPQVDGVALVKDLPLADGDTKVPVRLGAGGGAEEPPPLPVRLVSGDYFRTLRIPLLSGRGLASDGGGATTAVINRALARRLPAAGSGGQALSLEWFGEEVEATVVGVVGDVHHRGADVAADAAVYVPLSRLPYPDATLVVRVAAADPMILASPLRTIVSELDPDLPVERIEPLTAVVDRGTARQRFVAWLGAAFATAALVLSILGLYGVMAYSVQRGARQIAIRMALGADRRSVLGHGMRRVLGLTASGVLLGAGLALATGRWLSSLLFQVPRTDAASFVAAFVLVSTLALLAGYLPTRRATRVEPTVILRSE